MNAFVEDLKLGWKVFSDQEYKMTNRNFSLRGSSPTNAIQSLHSQKSFLAIEGKGGKQ